MAGTGGAALMEREEIEDEVTRTLRQQQTIPIAVDVKTAASILGMTSEAVYQQIKKGRIRATRPGSGRSVRIQVADLRAFLRARDGGSDDTIDVSPLLKVDEAAALIGVGARTLRAMIEDGVFPSIKFGAHVRVDAADIERWKSLHRTGDK